jgi:DNA-binding GntR family transcriptional regulator
LDHQFDPGNSRYGQGRLQFGIDGLADDLAGPARADFDDYDFPASGLPLSRWCVSARSTLALQAGSGCGQISGSFWWPGFGDLFCKSERDEVRLYTLYFLVINDLRKNVYAKIKIIDNIWLRWFLVAKMSVALSRTNESQNPRSRAVDVERAVAQWIFKGELTAGQKLTEQEVALRLGVSRGPVREAFRALEDLGLVQIEQNRGAFVRKIDLDEAIEIHDVYSALEELATRTAARRLSARQIAELQSLVESMDAAAEAEDLDRYYSLNLSFHQCLAEGSGNQKLLSIYNRLLNELHLFRRFGLMQRGEMQLSNGEHHQILDKIAAGDPEGAAEAMRSHTSERRRKMLLGSEKFDPKSH